MARRPTTAEKFARSYGQRASQRPRGGQGRIQNVQKEEFRGRGYGRRRRGRSKLPPGQTEDGNIESTPYTDQDESRTRNGATRVTKKTYDDLERDGGGAVQTQPITGNSVLQSLKTMTLSEKEESLLGKKKGKLRRAWGAYRKGKAYLKVGRLTWVAAPPLATAYIVFQLPFAILGLALGGAAALYFEFRDSVADSIVGKIAGLAGKTVAAALEFLTGGALSFDVVFNAIADAPAIIWLAVWSAVMIFGWGVLLALTFVYTASGIRCLSGERAGLKHGLFLLCIFGYWFPFITQLVPWFAFWMLAVLRYPR